MSIYNLYKGEFGFSLLIEMSRIEEVIILLNTLLTKSYLQYYVKF